MDTSRLESQAINAALAGNWKEAVRINLSILKSAPRDTETLNRLARAYFQIGLKTKASTTYQKVLRIDKFNSIAIKNLELVKNSKIDRGAKTPINAQLPVFLEEPGITKTVALMRPSEPKVLAHMHPGDPVKIAPRQHCVSVTNIDGHNLGRLSDDLAARLQTFIKAGSTYSAWVKSVDAANLKIFIREIHRAVSYKDTPPFPLTEKLTYAAFTPPELIHQEKPDVSSTEDQDLVPIDTEEIETSTE